MGSQWQGQGQWRRQWAWAAGARTLVLWAGLALATGAAMAQQHAVPRLSAASPFAAPGGTLVLQVTGSPGALVRIVTSPQAAEQNLGAAGIQFYKAGTQTTVAAGSIPAGGSFSATLSIPANAAPGSIVYAQALSQLGGQSLLSNGLAYRVQAAPPSGARKTSAIAVTPDGTRAYVADKLSGVITVLNAVNDTKLADLPITSAVGTTPHRPIRIAVDPEGRHAFIANTTASTLSVIHTATGSVAAQIPVPRGSRGIGFDFRNGTRRIYLANETQGAVLVFKEAPLGVFTAQPAIPLRSAAPGPLLVLPDGKLAVGARTDNVIEILDPAAPAGATTVAITAISGAPHELAWSGSDILIPTFVVFSQARVPGFNRVLRMDPATYQVTGYLLDNVGTDYRSIAVRPTTLPGQPLIAVNGSGTGTTLIVDGNTGATLANLVLSTSYPDATPQDLAIVNNPATKLPSKLYVVDLFRETVRPILLTGSPLYKLRPEIPLAWSGQVRVPGTGVLSAADEGEWMFRNVVALGGTATAPNSVTCNSCHMDGASDNSSLHVVEAPGLQSLQAARKPAGHGTMAKAVNPSADVPIGVPIQVPAPWGAVETAPFFWDGSVPTIQRLVAGAQALHNHTGQPPPSGATTALLNFLTGHLPPASIYLNQDGSMTADQQAGKAIFEGSARCTQCHAGSTFIPPAGSPLTIPDGIGTTLVPANVPSLRGAWATAPYLSQGQAKTLMDVLTMNPNDAHGQAAAPLTDAERKQLVEYLKVL
ncbi:hypothetical protein LRH25_03540 [Ideonella azotifigens]|nr:beta-propeller fold lactonase family protein [Ideonella azotifigens]MCD2339409.1 hypothetical protein [Ideonella azotifigens]